MSAVQEYIKLSCSDCEHYKKVEFSGKRMTLQCTNPEAFKEDKGATKIGCINSNIARRFEKYCGKKAFYFLEKVPEPEPEPKETLSWKTFAKAILGSNDKEIIVGVFTKGLIFIVITVITILAIF